MNDLGILDLHHVGIAVGDLAAARALYLEALGLEDAGSDRVESQGVRLFFARAGRGLVECLEPERPDSPLARFLERRGPGLHHIAYRVRDLVATLEELRRRGARLVDEKPRPGAHGTRIAFVHPSATGGVLTEFVEDSLTDPKGAR